MKKNGSMKRLSVLVAVCAMAVMLLAMQVMARPGDEKYQKTAEQIAKKTGTQTVRTIWWSAKMKKKVSVRTVDTGEEIKLKRGAKVTIVQRDYHSANGISLCRVKGKYYCYIPNKYLRIRSAITTGAKGDYKKATKLAYINGQNISSKTNTLIWISLDKQRVNIFKGQNRQWNLVRTCKASSGKADAPTLDQTFKSVYVVQKKKQKVNDLYYYTFFFGSGIHKWPGAGMGKSLGKTPCSHSCVRLNGTNAKWVFNNENVPVNTRVWIW